MLWYTRLDKGESLLPPEEVQKGTGGGSFSSFFLWTEGLLDALVICPTACLQEAQPEPDKGPSPPPHGLVLDQSRSSLATSVFPPVPQAYPTQLLTLTCTRLNGHWVDSR